MDEVAIVLQTIHDELDQQVPNSVRPLSLADSLLSVLDGKLRLSAAVYHDPDTHPTLAHCHVVAEISDPPRRLEACVNGIHSDRSQALADAAHAWVQAAAGPILSLLHARPVMNATHFDGSEPWGVSGCHGFVGPLCARFVDETSDFGDLGKAGVFDYAAEMAPPGVVHLAKATLNAHGTAGWHRTLEIDGHTASYTDCSWNTGSPTPTRGLVTQFATFHYGDQPSYIETRQKVDDALRQFVLAFQATEDTDRAAAMLADAGVDPDLVHWVALFVPLACSRVIFRSLGVSFPSDYIQVGRDGTAKTGLKLMRQPVFARAMSLSEEFLASDLLDTVKKLALTSSELHAINNALYAGSKPENLRLSDPVIPAPGASTDAVEQVLRQITDRMRQEVAAVRARPWWKFW